MEKLNDDDVEVTRIKEEKKRKKEQEVKKPTSAFVAPAIETPPVDTMPITHPMPSFAFTGEGAFPQYAFAVRTTYTISLFSTLIVITML